MVDLNKVFLAGNLTRDPELRYTANGTAVANLSLAVSRTFTAKDGTKKDEVAFVNIIVWGRQAETCGEYLSKGSSILVEGRLQLDRWETNTGEKRNQLKVIAQRIQFLSTRRRGEEKPAAAEDMQDVSGSIEEADEVPLDEDIPF
ncbi:MAG: single-stranded DNA-binding protein [Candidatus Aureabacteria bacterium]|nr:single-stranded DNA-binding protein [Candidatus Auribacterota bacterium]